jgi:hypothetical protein
MNTTQNHSINSNTATATADSPLTTLLQTKPNHPNPFSLLLQEAGGELGTLLSGDDPDNKLNPQALTKWLESRYEDYLKKGEAIEALKTQAEFAGDLLRELGEMDRSAIHHACLVAASLQIFHAIMEYGDEAIRDALEGKPASYFTMLNTLCNVSNASMKQEADRKSPPG